MSTARNSDHLFTVGEVVAYAGNELAIISISGCHENPSGESVDLLELDDGTFVTSDLVELV